MKKWILFLFLIFVGEVLFAQGGSDCATASANPLVLGQTYTGQTTCGFTAYPNAFSCVDSAWYSTTYMGGGILYKICTPSSGILDLDFSNVSFNGTIDYHEIYVQILTDCPSNNGACIGGSYDPWMGYSSWYMDLTTGPLNYSTSVPIPAAGCYYILINDVEWGGNGIPCANFDISSSFSPYNTLGANDCAGASVNPLNTGTSYDAVTTCGFTAMPSANFCADSAGINYPLTPGSIYNFCAPGDGYMQVNLTDVIPIHPNGFNGWSSSYLYFQVFDGCPASGNCIYSNANPSSGNNGYSSWAMTAMDSSSFAIPVQTGHCYYIQINGFNMQDPNLCFVFDLSLEFIQFNVQPPCSNLGFEADLAFWVGTVGKTVSGVIGDPSPEYIMQSFGTANPQFTIMTGGNDPIGGFPRVFNGAKSLRIGDSTVTGAKGASLEQTFFVTTDNANHTYNYALVLNSGGHQPHQQPFFMVDVFDEFGNEITCGEYLITAPLVAGNGWIQSGTRFYKPWSSVNVNLSSYVGQNVKIRFTIGDCPLSGHYGYGYIDGACSPFEITGDDTICIGQTTTLSAPIGASSYLWNPGGQTTSSITVSPNTTTIYTCDVVTQGNTPCLATMRDTVVVFDPQISLSTAQNVSCFSGSNGIISIDVGGGFSAYTYNWSPAPGIGQGTDSISSLTAQTYNLDVADALGCSTSFSFTITEPDALVVNTSLLNHVTCNGAANGSVNISVNGGTAPYTYLWNPAPAAGQGTPSLSSLSPGNYTVTVTDANNCSSTHSVSITEPNALSVSVNNFANISCFNANDGVINTTADGGTAPYTYSWNPLPGAGQGTPSISSLSAGNYTITVTDANNCTANISQNITQPSALIINNGPTTNVSCFGGNNGSGSVIVSGGIPGYVYNWSPSPGSGQGTSSIQTLTAGTYAVNVNDANGCSISSIINITEPTAFTASTSIPVNVSCYGGNNGSVSAIPNGGIGPYTYNWSPAPGAGQGTPNATSLFAGNYNVVITDAHGCTTTASANITEPVPFLLIPGNINDATCNGGADGDAQFSVTGGTAPYSYNWNPAPGSGQGTTFGSGLSAQVYTVTISDNQGCTTSGNITINEPAALSTISQIDSVSCFGFSDGSISVFASGGTAPYNYNWATPGISGQGTSIVSSLQAGNYQMTLSDVNGCTAVMNYLVFEPNQLSVSISGNDSICIGQSVTLTASPTGGTPGFQYVWNNGQTQQNSIQNPMADLQTQVTVTDQNSCTAVAYFGVVVVPMPEALYTISDTSACGSLCVDFTNMSLNATSISWNFGDGVSTTQTNPTHCYVNSGDFTPTLIATNPIGCSDTLSVNHQIHVYPIPEAIIGATPMHTDINNMNINFYDLSDNAVSWQWEFGDNLGNSTLQNPTYTYSDTGHFTATLQITNQFGCSDTATLVITISDIPSEFVPNAFSPDGDGDNEIFKPILATPEMVTTYQFQIFNRWGELIFESSNYELGWDGTHKNQECKQDVYVWKLKIKYNGKPEPSEHNGHVTLLR
jgi:gliding motility-associated-like protein